MEGGLHMHPKQRHDTIRASRRRAIRGTATIALAVAGIVFAAVPAATAAPSPTATPSPIPSTSAPPGPASPAPAFTPKKPASCVKGPDGKPTACPPALKQAQLPAGAKNKNPLGTVSDPATLVDTRTWTSSGGNTFPGADVPFGMVQWSPDTMPTYNAGGGYQFGDESLWGYSLTHISGPGCGAGGDVPILPMTGALPSGDPAQATTSFTNTGEVAQACYYSAVNNLPS